VTDLVFLLARHRQWRHYIFYGLVSVILGGPLTLMVTVLYYAPGDH